MAENKVQFNLKNVHYAVQTATTSGGVVSYSYGTPVAVPGAVTLSLEAQGDVTPFYADGVTYYTSIANNGYSGNLDMARFPDQMLKDIWGFSLGTTSKVLTENASVEPKAFALLYQIDGDADNQLYVLYNCTGTRPNIGSTTNTATKEPQTQTSSITAAPRADSLVFARTTADTPTATRSAWFSSVFEESATPPNEQNRNGEGDGN